MPKVTAGRENTGDADQVLPLDKTAKRLPGLINDVQLTVVEGGPHAIPLDPRRPGQHRTTRLPAPLMARHPVPPRHREHGI